MLIADLLGCRYAGDDPKTFGIDLDREHAKDAHVSARSRLLADAISIGPELMPALHASIGAASSRLGLQSAIPGYVYSDPSPQAACVHIGGEDKSALMLSSGLIQLMSDEELTFVIGHEIGHMFFEHNLYPRPTDATGDGTRLNWLALQRAGEISADRIGLLACGSIDVAYRTILKTGTGLSEEYLRFDLASFLDQLRGLKSIGGHASGIVASHPILTVRMKALLWFEMSEAARRLNGTGTHGLALERVDKRVESLLEEATGQMLARVRAESFSRAAMWAVLFAAVSDGVFSKEEQAGIERLYGRPAVQSALSYVRENGPGKVGIQFEDAIREVRFHPETGRREFWQRLRNDLSTLGIEESQFGRVLTIVEDRLGLAAQRH
ncbi:M48 family metallopeptidase [Thioalkalivibrio sp. XN8]|uniref:M48 family metallopeptidase n=1 Tax=Thioalkalivibrio sp. XN8 TaxID=2712863 RepID=UPI0013ED685D|nr:M48 family metallopeptidase [Thioalkalivibrio sp. XN8]NGP53583.1 M48 family metallopeptidase [Thioalkalivibrio sp. XN8]